MTRLTDAERNILRDWWDSTTNQGDLFVAVESIIAAREAAVVQRVVEDLADGPGWFWTQTEWAEWSNDLARMIPEDDIGRYSNPDGAQESIIEDCLAAYIADRESAAEKEEVMPTEMVSAMQRVLDDEIANLADDGARLSHSVVRRMQAVLVAVREVSAEKEKVMPDEPCICNTGPSADGPDECCPVHGRPYSYWVDGCAAAEVALQQTVDAVEALAEEWEAHVEPPDEEYEGTQEGHWAFGEHLATRNCAKALRAALARAKP